MHCGIVLTSLLLSQSGIFKVRGVATWVLAFVYVVGLIQRCQSVNALASFFNKDSLLQRMTGIQTVTQSALSRFLTGFSQWDMFNQKRTARLQEDPDTALVEGDVLALDDTHAAHPYAKGIPFLYWLYDSSSKVYTWAMNIVALHAVRSKDLNIPGPMPSGRSPKTMLTRSNRNWTSHGRCSRRSEYRLGVACR
ncbi:hypothetical protein MM817_00213 [Acidibacillus sp. S0AB]|uniref:Transposase IS701-like DDE domain-containing protein n=1 Tax=Sulfoacidibacillus ferrooxidans TaxID=2005001 RepID=A0A9X2AD58_9BACL|nr:hypothetical protein [Sulfoacidibacillus ferrooxidans]